MGNGHLKSIVNYANVYSIHIAACHSWKNILGELPQTATAKAEYIYREIERMILLNSNDK